MNLAATLPAALAVCLILATGAVEGVAPIPPSNPLPMTPGGGTDICNEPGDPIVELNCIALLRQLFDPLEAAADIVDIILCALGLGCDTAAASVADLEDDVHGAFDTLEQEYCLLLGC